MESIRIEYDWLRKLLPEGFPYFNAIHQFF